MIYLTDIRCFLDSGPRFAKTRLFLIEINQEILESTSHFILLSLQS